MTDAKTPRDVLAEWIDVCPDGYAPDYEFADDVIGALTAGNYQITPAVRDDRARVENKQPAAWGLWDVNGGLLTSTECREQAEKWTADYVDTPSLSVEPLYLRVSDAVAGAGRDGDALDARRVEFLRKALVHVAFMCGEENPSADEITAYVMNAHKYEVMDAVLTPTTEPGS